jgi:hypothetical protein
MGSTLSLSESVSGGVWTSATTSVATISATGVVTPVAVGSTTISYAVTNICNTGYATTVVNVEAPAGSITGPDTVCEGASIILSTNPTGGDWASSNATIASVTTAGSVTGMSPGLASITYSLTNSCGTTTSTYMVHVFSTGYCDSMTAVPSIVGQTNQVTVFPNPSTGAFNMLISSANSENAAITVSNVVGQKVKEMTVTTNNEVNVDLGNASGIYLIHVHTTHSDTDTKVSIIK